jgi:hypothetical protein
MRKRDFIRLSATALASAPAIMMSRGAAAQAAAPAAPPAPLPTYAPSLPPSLAVDLTTPEGMSAFAAQWKNMDAKIIEVPAMPMAGPAWKTAYDLTPKAGEANFDDSAWPVIEPKGLLERRGGGRAPPRSRASTCPIA